MRLNEITKAEFVDGLKDPAMAELKKMNRDIKKELNVAGVMYSVKTYEHPSLGTRRKAEIMWDFRYVPQEALAYLSRIDTRIGSHYKNNLENWTLKGWDSMSNTSTYELLEK